MMNHTVIKEKIVSCQHCGEPCDEQIIESNESYFCCEGCKLVFELIQENDLSNFYCVADKPGVSRRKGQQNSFNFLNDEAFANSLLDFKNESVSKVRFYIPAIHCSACIWLLEKLYKLNDGIQSSRVDFNKKTVNISFDHHKVSLLELVKLLDSLAYTPDIQLDKKDHKTNPYRRIWLQLGIAGFVFGNSMLFSLPEYFGMDIFNGSGIESLFPYLNAVLALPVLLYSAQDYYKSSWGAIRQKQINMDVPISIGIIALFTYSYYIIFFQSGLGYLDSLAGLLFFLLLGKLYQQKTFDHLRFDRDVKSFFPLSVTRIAQNKEEQVLLNSVLPSDVLRIRNEEIIPADSLLLSDEALIDYSFVTGESMPESKQKEELIYAGGRLKGASVLIQVKKRPSQSYLSQLWDDESLQHHSKAKVQNTADRISKYFTAIVLVIAVVAGIYWMMAGTADQALKAFTSVLIIACPCALAMATPVTLGTAMRVLGKHGFFVKNTHSIEQMSAIDTVVFDKTGTLTYPDKAEVTFEGTLPDHKILAAISSVLNQSKHPLSRIIYNWLPFYPQQNITDFKETAGQGISASVNGKVVKIGKQSFVEPDKEVASSENNSSVVFVSVDGQTVGSFSVRHVFRKGMGDLLSNLNQNFELHLLSGDNPSEKDYLKKWIAPDNMYFQQLPGQKRDFIQKLQEENHKVLMAGDGLNDSGALMKSDFGLAVTESTSQFSPACDAIMLGNQFTSLPLFMKFSKRSYYMVLAGFVLSFSYNVVGLSFAVQAMLSPVIAAVLMPVSSVSVVMLGTLGVKYLSKKSGLHHAKDLKL
ncbi:heavy metal translocating P-type ATPase metal-binding domain-containing protein [Marivirga sp. S37H4]|uniref:Heavy metal translocating P-type ATPase metal-binding domain-containing protein n=1 Tax=Marivirga aurantiaca TaxID=2802615 RepID=A0A935CB27_9BACT|nr:heavy metal translocating P-type ATPase metal-binding domain-containing protein [Marivirga aurantiaca]MBK6266859.1 heavy metal translocating P-type ATPase metal-binding domain-containing protein [Marivirga aurantiaca]